MSKTAIDVIQKTVRGNVILSAPMAGRTTNRAGGAADLMIQPADREDLAALLRFLSDREIDTLVMGSGSSMIVRDGGIRGAVLDLSQGFMGIERLPDLDDEPRIRAEAGVTIRRLVRWCVDEQISSVEPLYGIPGAVGGAVVNNTGAWGTQMSDLLIQVETIAPDGSLHEIPAHELGLGYRSSRLPEGHVILAATLRGETRPSDEIKQRIQEFHNKRRSLHPIHEPCAGMVFLNPEGRLAGEMIDNCGLKGVRVGDAEISRLHANFIVNLGHATTAHLISLVGMIQERVYVNERIKLEPKVHVVGSRASGSLRIRE
jgi:UDP-N-acetylmuramate dehydrogenase